MQSIEAGTDVQNLGGGGWGGGFGGFGGGNPLLYLITLGFLKGDGGLFGGNNNNNNEGAAGVLAGQTQSKLDCLTQNQNQIQDQINNQTNGQRFQALETAVNNSANIARDINFNLANIGRDMQDIIFRESSNTQRQIAACCCDLKTGQAEIKADMNSQTAALLRAGDQNTQAILDRLCNTTIEGLRTDNANLRSNLNKAEIIAQINEECGGRRRGLQVS